MEILKSYLARIDDLGLRERGIIMAGILILLFLGWYAWLMEPILKEQTALQQQLGEKSNQLQTLNSQLDEMSRRLNNDPEETDRASLQALREEIRMGQETLQKATVNLVSPEQMPDILQQVLNRTTGLALIRLQGLGATPLLDESQGGTPAETEPNARGRGGLSAAYRHGMKIVFRGGFLETLAYIDALENLASGFFWEGIDYKVAEYPLAETTLTLYTISLDSNWISI